MDAGGEIHVFFNAAAEGETVIYVMFLGVPDGAPISMPVDPPC
jgi:hypothetical protein